MYLHDEVHLGSPESTPPFVLLPASRLSLLHRASGDSVYYGMPKKGQTSHAHLRVYGGEGQ